MTPVYKPSLIDRAVCAIAPISGMRRMAAQRILHQYRYDGAEMSHKRGSATQNMSPNAFDVQRDRLQLMREAEDLERNFAPAAMLNRKYAMYTTPISYHAQTGDAGLNKAVEDYLNDEVFPVCDHTGRYPFYRMLEFAIMGMNRGGDYGFAFTRPGMPDGISPEDAVNYDLKIQAIEPDRIGGVYQNVVSNDYVAGLLIGDHGQIDAFRVFHRSMTTNCYDDPIDVPADQFVHITDPLRIDMYRGVSRLATSACNLRDLYEMIDFVKGKVKLSSALTVFTNSNGAMVGPGGFDPYGVTLSPESSDQGLQQDISFGQINHLAGGTDIKFPSSTTPSSEEQWVMVQLLKFLAMSYHLPYSFALDAAALGGVSSRLESEMAKAEFERGQSVITPHANRIKNAYLIDAVAKGIFNASDMRKIFRGRWGFRAHPQPDIGKEASAAVSLYQNGMLNPIKHWTDNAEDPEEVAADMVRWAQIKGKAVEGTGLEVQAVFGNGPAMPLSVSESSTESTQSDTDADKKGKQFSRHEYRESDSGIAQRINESQSEIAELIERRNKFKGDLIDYEKTDAAPSLKQRARISIDRINQEISDAQSDLDELMARQERRSGKKVKKPEETPKQSEETPKQSEETPKQSEARAKKDVKRNDRHALVMALLAQGYPALEAYAISYDIVESGKFDPSKLPEDIKEKYNYSKAYSNGFDESKHPRGDNGEFGSGESAALDKKAPEVENSVIRVAGKDRRVKEVLDILSKARKNIETLDSTEYAYKLAKDDIAKYAPVLKEKGIAENSTIRGEGSQRDDQNREGQLKSNNKTPVESKAQSLIHHITKEGGLDRLRETANKNGLTLEQAAASKMIPRSAMADPKVIEILSDKKRAIEALTRISNLEEKDESDGGEKRIIEAIKSEKTP